MTALIDAVEYVCEERGGREWERECVCGCDCVDVGVGVIAWVRKRVCACDSLDCCLKVHVCSCMCVSGEEGKRERGVCVWVGVTVWVWV